MLVVRFYFVVCFFCVLFVFASIRSSYCSSPILKNLDKALPYLKRHMVSRGGVGEGSCLISRHVVWDSLKGGARSFISRYVKWSRHLCGLIGVALMALQVKYWHYKNTVIRMLWASVIPWVKMPLGALLQSWNCLSSLLSVEYLLLEHQMRVCSMSKGSSRL